MSVNFILQKFNKVKKTNNNIYYTYILFSKTKTLQENIDWSNVKEENVPIFVPPITFGKVLKTWFDETQMDGNIRFRMAEGIDNTKCVVVFITKEYRDKVNGIDMTDNCKYEFSYAMNQLGSQNMIPVVLEAEMRDTKKWKGELGAALGSMMYVDLSVASLSKDQKETEETMIELKYEDISRKIRKIVEREKRKSNKQMIDKTVS